MTTLLESGRRALARCSVLALFMGVSLSFGASCQQESLSTRYAKVRNACRFGDLATAKRITDELLEDSERFRDDWKKAHDQAAASGPEYCSPVVMSRVERLIAIKD